MTRITDTITTCQPGLLAVYSWCSHHKEFVGIMVDWSTGDVKTLRKNKNCCQTTWKSGCSRNLCCRKALAELTSIGKGSSEGFVCRVGGFWFLMLASLTLRLASILKSICIVRFYIVNNIYYAQRQGLWVSKGSVHIWVHSPTECNVSLEKKKFTYYSWKTDHLLYMEDDIHSYEMTITL